MSVYEAADAALIRATAAPADLDLPSWPDLTFEDPAEWRAWTRQVWELAGFADAVRDAAPDLAGQVERHLHTPSSAATHQPHVFGSMFLPPSKAHTAGEGDEVHICDHAVRRAVEA